MNNDVYNGQRHDIPMDVWTALLEAVREMKALSSSDSTKDGEAA